MKRPGGTLNVSERRQPEKATHCTVPPMRQAGKAKLWTEKKDQWLPGAGGEGDAQAELRGVQGCEATAHDTVTMDTGLYPTEGTTPRVTPNVNYGLWVIRMCQCGFSYCNRCSIWWETLIVRKAGGCGGAVRLLLDSAVNPKLLQNNSPFKKSAAALKTSL